MNHVNDDEFFDEKIERELNRIFHKDVINIIQMIFSIQSIVAFVFLFFWVFFNIIFILFTKLGKIYFLIDLSYFFLGAAVFGFAQMYFFEKVLKRKIPVFNREALLRSPLRPLRAMSWEVLEERFEQRKSASRVRASSQK